MVDCLASTGMDAFLPLVIAALLILGGIGAAVVAFRRGRAGAALMLGLVLIVAPLSFGSAPSAHAADNCETTSESAPAPAAPQSGNAPTGVDPICVPKEAISDISVTLGEWVYENEIDGWVLVGTNAQTPSPEVALALQALQETGGTPDFTSFRLTSYDSSGAVLTSLPVSPEDLATGGEDSEGDPNATAIPDAMFDELAADGWPAAIGMGYTLQYSDGCDGDLNTKVEIRGTFISPP
jgi:hypothetical protein